jgi:chromosome segregation ATPase
MQDPPRTRRKAAPFLLVGLLAASFSVPAHASNPAPKKAPVKQQSKSKPKPMSRDQLRSCMDQQDRLMVMRENVLKEQTSLDQQRAEVKSIDAELERKRAALDPADAVAKQALQDEETRRNQLGDTYNARLPSLKEQGATLDKERQNWVERCADKDFDEIDEAAIKRERQRAAKAAGTKAAPK